MVNKNIYTAIEHVDNLIGDIEEHIKNKQDFVAFILIALGIEFMGSFFDEKEFNLPGNSDSRFKNGISKLFKKEWYKNNATWIYKQFRGPLIHQYRTGDEILLSSVCKNNAPISEHLVLKKGKRVFILEGLFADFKEAVDRLKNITRLQKQNHITSCKIEQEYLVIAEIESTMDTSQINYNIPTYSVSGDTTAFGSSKKKKNK